jgi:large subunit ribosomal protein L24
MKTAFSKKWKKSTKARKQRKFRHNAPLHTKQKFMHSHLSKTLRKKYGKRAVGLRKGDKVKIMRGQYKKKTGKVERIDLKKNLAYVSDIEVIRKDGSKRLIGVYPSKLMIEELNLEDKRRAKAIEGRKAGEKPEQKKEIEK